MKKISSFFIRLYNHFFNTACFARAGALAFTTILAVVPLMVMAMSTLSWLPIAEKWLPHVQKFIFSNFVASSGSQVLYYLELFVARVHELSVVSILFLMVTAVTMLFSIESTLNAIWEVNAPRTFWKAIFFYILILVFAPMLILMSIILSGVGLKFLGNMLGIKLFLHVSFKFLPMGLSFLGYMLVYKIMPHCKVPWRTAVISALVAAILFEAAKNIFTWYLKAFPTYQIIYGAVAAFPIFLIWIYICWMIFLIGAAFGYVLKNCHPEA